MRKITTEELADILAEAFIGWGDIDYYLLEAVRDGNLDSDDDNYAACEGAYDATKWLRSF